jgi:hypothetical protein
MKNARSKFSAKLAKSSLAINRNQFSSLDSKVILGIGDVQGVVDGELFVVGDSFILSRQVCMMSTW